MSHIGYNWPYQNQVLQNQIGPSKIRSFKTVFDLQGISQQSVTIQFYSRLLISNIRAANLFEQPTIFFVVNFRLRHHFWYKPEERFWLHSKLLHLKFQSVQINPTQVFPILKKSHTLKSYPRFLILTPLMYNV